MTTFPERIRKPTTFILAVFLWLHAVFFFNFHSTIITKLAQSLRLTTSEVALFVLLVIASLVTGSGFWKTVLSVVYIYFFPFVVFGYFCYGCFLGVRAINRWFNSQLNPGLKEIEIAVQRDTAMPPTGTPPLPPSAKQPGTRKRAAEVLLVLLRPFRRFTVLWCLLLVMTTHLWILWISLIIVLLHVARAVFHVLKVTLFSGPLLAKVGQQLAKTVSGHIESLQSVKPENTPIDQLRNLWNQVQGVEKAAAFLSNRNLVFTWAWVLVAVFLGLVHVYMAFMFSFVYYGIAKVSGVVYPWHEALVNSLCIQLFAGDMPKIVSIKLLACIQYLLVFAVFVGTVINYIRRRLDSIHAAAVEINTRFADALLRERYLLLKEKFAPTEKTLSLPPKSEGG